jgi:hypothetical protein
MAIYKILAWHEVVEEAYIEVEADSEEEALAKARSPEELSYAHWSLTDSIGDTQFQVYEVEESA